MTSKNKQNIFKNYGDRIDNTDFDSKSIDDRINEIENRIRGLYDNKMPQNLNINRQQVVNDLSLKQKLDTFRDNLKQLSDNMNNSVSDSTGSDTQSIFSEATNKYSDITGRKDDIADAINEIQEKIANLSAIVEKSQVNEVKSKTENLPENISDKDKELFTKMFNAFYEESKNVKQKPDDGVVKDKLENIDEQIKNIKDGLSNLHTQTPVTTNKVEVKIEDKNEPAHTEVKLTSHKKSVEEEKKAPILNGAQQKTPHGPITVRPKQKKEGLFNDANLTEDYELGFRFHELGFKTGFFNVMLDDEDDASRIATAEFFPNTFWAAVKQRSRWVAGIVFQNSKSHHWSGNLTTKYFLFRDRKSVLSFFGAFLSNIVLFYLIFAVLSKLFQWTHVNSLVAHSSVLWLLMIANLVFMISRLSHRFIFTYNWYGFRYAFFSIFRLPVDTVVNFFAIARSLSVYRNTKSKAKVVWDSTTHY